jgi:hypothetical protein
MCESTWAARTRRRDAPVAESNADAPPETELNAGPLPSLKTADQLYQSASFGQSIATLDRLLRMVIDDKVRKDALYLMALNFFSLRNETRAQSAFQDLLDFDPDFQMPALASPSTRAFFQKVKGAYRIIPVIEHTPPAQIDAQQGATLEVTLKKMRTSYVPKLFFRKPEQPYFSNVDLTLRVGGMDKSPSYEAVLPPAMLLAAAGYPLEYFIVVADGETPLTQLRNPQAPFSVPVDVPVSLATQPVYKRWYFWVLLLGGVAAIGATAATLVILRAQQRGDADVVFRFE